MSRDRVPHLVVVGGGFAGLWATRALARERIRITLVDRRNHHLFQPLLYQVATAGLSAPDIAAPLRHILGHQRNVEVRLGEVVGIDKEARQVRMADGSTLDYDSLLLATGATHAYFGHDEWADDAEPDPAKKAAWLSFAVVGGGPTGVELAGTLAEIARHTLRNEFRHIDPASAKVRLVEAGPRVLSTFPEVLSLKARRQLEKLGVEVMTGTPVSHIDGQGFKLGDQFVPARTVVWAAGVAASPLARTLDVPLDRAGRVQVQPDLTLPGHPELFVAGDLAALSQANGKPVPGVAPAAKQMGKYVAETLRARLHDKPAPGPFKYADFGNLATIGRMAAIVHLGKLQLSGVLAWWFWLAAHVFFLIGFRNRVVVLLNWAVAYWSYQRSARIIFGDDREDRRLRR
jgi:NADH dehydrogenase